MDCSHWVAKSCTTTAYRWLLRDSLRILWFASSPRKFQLWARMYKHVFCKKPSFFCLQADISILCFFVRVDTVLTRTWFHFARDSIGSSREVLAVSRYLGAGLLRGSLGLLSSTKLSLKSWNRSGKSCNRSVCTSSRPSLLFLFSVSVGLFCRFPRSSSLVLPLLSDTCFSVYLPFRLIWNPVMKMMMK